MERVNVNEEWATVLEHERHPVRVALLVWGWTPEGRGMRPVVRHVSFSLFTPMTAQEDLLGWLRARTLDRSGSVSAVPAEAEGETLPWD